MTTPTGAVPPANEGTGAEADAAPVDANPTEVDHEGTGPGDVDNLPESNTTADVEDQVDGTDNA